MKRFIFLISLLLISSLFTNQGLCHPPKDFKEQPTKEQVERIRKRIETLKMWKLTKILDLDEETASKLFPILNKYDKKRLAIEQEIRKDMKRLRKSIDTATENELRDIIKILKGHHRELEELNDEEMEELEGILSVKDIAKLIVFKHDFNREIRGLIEDARKKRRRLKERD
jgi:hypothetical protein